MEDASGSVYAEALNALAFWREAHSDELTVEQAQRVLEIRRLLDRLIPRYGRLLALNAELERLSPLNLETRFDQESDTLTTFVNGEAVISLKLNRADPNIPLQFHPVGRVEAYTLQDSDVTAEENRLRTEMETLLEVYYYSAHRVCKLIQKLPDGRRFKSDAVTIVRNKLIEHTEGGDIYSFGVGSTGPRVKPITRGPPTWNDNGLIPNTREFADNIAEHFRQKTPQSLPPSRSG